MRFGLLYRYQEIEGSRRDESEGRVSLFYPGRDYRIHFTSTSQHPYYILCTCGPDLDVCALARKFGAAFLVRITDSAKLLERIHSVWSTHEWKDEGRACVVPVEYTKHELFQPDPYFNPPPHLTYCQKPRKFEDEKECRYVIGCRYALRNLLPDPIVLDVGDCQDIMRLEACACEVDV